MTLKDRLCQPIVLHWSNGRKTFVRTEVLANTKEEAEGLSIVRVELLTPRRLRDDECWVNADE